MSFRFNRTFMELKFSLIGRALLHSFCFNRTFMELKYAPLPVSDTL